MPSRACGAQMMGEMERSLPIFHIMRCRFGATPGSMIEPYHVQPPSYPSFGAPGTGPPPQPPPPGASAVVAAAAAAHHHHAAAAAHAGFLHYARVAARCYHPCGHVASEGYRVCCKKYVVLCWLCGGLSVAVGSLFLLVHAVLSANTASLALFETVPSYIPGTMLIFIGLCTMLLARRKHRYGSLMKVCGSVSTVCALVCVLVTVTTTVVHMSRLQSLHECVYTTRAKLCTCYSASQSHGTDQGVLFEGTPHCEVVHGALYTCLRTLFGVSVAGILACIFSCMLVYQLHRHEKKKMYWEQLELRCRSLYGQGAAAAAAAAAGLVGTGRPAGTCGCCNDCGGIGPWWAQSPGNLYTPNPDLTPARRWRLPWSRSRGPAPSADSNYGFDQSNRSAIVPGSTHHHPADGILDNAGMVPYGILGPTQSAGPYSVLQAAVHEDHHYGQNAGAGPYSVLEAAVPLWGPPPPYSDPNSPARRFVYRTNEHRPRATKRIDSFPMREVEYNSRTSDIKRQGSSNNYENAEPLSMVSNDTDTETTAEARVARANNANKHKKLLKGVENAGFQEQESNATSKQQSESELYFGDVSSCCGPESSLYDVATDKEGKNESCQSEASTSYLPAQHKRPSSRRSRRQQQQPIDLLDLPSNSSCSSNCDEAGSLSYALHTAADIEYEVIRENSRYDDYEASGAAYAPEEKNNDEETEKRSEEEAYGGADGAVEVEEPKEEDEEEEEEEEFGEFRSSSFHEDVRPVKV
ncbi:uncharacterized protein LOC106639137 [Copidosoma floridanum]|uniref:uncharacterized protein LOC106639137 n=1 Tax=Copidosoma floridanum TaxID=29053 RepID=UPI0006C9B0D3|nr:uncharacterized protein LOC106639137 [Copidosoma floridanum]